MLKLKFLDEQTLGEFSAKESELVGIWPEEVRNDVKEGTYTCVNKESEPVFLIELDSAVVGITGWFDDTDGPNGYAALRWTGILKEHQSKGIGSKVLTLLEAECAVRRPDVKGFVEYVLDEEFMPDVRPFFLKMGFVARARAVREDVLYVWKPYVFTFESR